MRKVEDLKFGCTGGGAIHQDTYMPPPREKVKMVAEARVFDYIDKTPPLEELEEYAKASQEFGLPILSCGWFYTLGRDEKLAERNLYFARELGSVVHNTQVMTNNVDGRPVTDQEVADFYCRIVDFGAKMGVTPCLEVHVNMWSEHVGRVEKVAQLVKKRGIPFYMTLDHSHVIFKIDNPREQEVQNMKADIDAGLLELHPDKPGNVTSAWIANNYVKLMHARAAVPNNPLNIWGKHPDGRVGRGIQYPFIKPKPGEWHSEWDERKLEPWKQVVRNLLSHHAREPKSPLGFVSCEFIPPPDYGGGAKYSIFEQNVECAKWMRQLWADTLKKAAA